MSLLALLLAAQDIAPRRDPLPYRPAPATVVAEPVALLFAGFDRDRDGRTTREECRQGIEDFGRADPAWSGSVGYLAFADWAQRQLGDRNAVPTPFEVDRNGDNRITLAELGDRIETIFARFDADKDGVVTRAELLTIRAAPDDRRDRRERRRDPVPPQR